MADEQGEKQQEADVTVHLIRAGRELLGAAKSVIEGLDAYLAMMEERGDSPQKAESSIQAIPIRREQA